MYVVLIIFEKPRPYATLSEIKVLNINYFIENIYIYTNTAIPVNI